MGRDPPPSIERSEQAVDGSLQCQRVEAHMAGFSEGLVNRRFERDDAAKELALVALALAACDAK